MRIVTAILLMVLAVKAGAYLLRWYEVTGSERYTDERHAGRYHRAVRALPAFVLEYLATLVIYAVWCVEMPYRAALRLLPARPPLAAQEEIAERAGSARPIILVHGFSMTPWSMGAFRWWLRRSHPGRPLYLLDYHPMFGAIDRFVPQLAELVDAACGDSPDRQVDLVAHSMGGLIAARYVAEHPGRVNKLVTVGTPFSGTRMWAMSVGRSLVQMRPGSEFLTTLHTHLHFPGTTKVTSIRSDFDEIILPNDSPCLPEGVAENIAVSGLGHAGLLLSPRVLKRVEEALAG